MVDVWNSVLDGLRDLAPRMLEKLPPAARDDVQIQHEAGRLLLEAVAAAALDVIAADGDRPIFLPSLNPVLNVYQPNADTVYKKARIAPGGSYRLRGRVGSLRIAKIGAMDPMAGAGQIHAARYFDLNELTVGEDGCFDVLLSPQKPDGHTGDWWELPPTATGLVLRQVAYDWAAERDPVISIERIDAPPTKPRPSAGLLAERMRSLVPTATHAATLLLPQFEERRHAGDANTFTEWDVVGGFGGLTGQFYYECVYELADDEALVMESDPPQTYSYASLLLVNEVYETIDWVNNHSSLNGAQWRVDSDGRLRVVVSAQDPGVPNWLDTAGYSTGLIQGRWTDASSTPMPTARVVKLSELSALLPADTPKVTVEERDRIIRDRRAQYQQRIFW